MTIPAVVIMFLLVTAASPVLLSAALLTDTARWMARRGPWVSVRMTGFLWCYLAGQIWALAALVVTFPLGTRRKEAATYRLQQTWAAWNLAAVRRLFGLEIDVTGDAVLQPGPIIVLSRHASLIDTLLPAVLISRQVGIRLRYVLKKELLVDPALDIAGHRTPNFFVDRGSGESDRERAGIRDLATGLGTEDGILIYPEGTRFSVAKRDRYAAPLIAKGGPVGELAGGFRWVLPPRPGGTLAIFDSARADIVVLAHTGLEGFATVADIWKGDLVGSRIKVDFRRIPASEIPGSRSNRLIWLFRQWAELDDWIDRHRSVGQQ
jgi:1-acyl-sn-glycerol-3-phosphate acyltransferase